ncbi:MAG: DNA mismatch repair protein MutL, partial [Dehalococcoidia bacterium]|nr:DNA mismatch repair protein MutL [Dehalococcoidia bacterium]
LYLPPDEVDVNIHPAKKEVRFYREGELYAFVRRAVREVIGQCASAKTAFTGAGALVSSLPNRPVLAPPGGFTPAPPGSLAQAPSPPLETPDPGPLRMHLPILRVVGQMGDTYIIAEGPDGMYLVDQHTAHERVLYEKIKGNGAEVGKQGLLDPLVLELPPAQVALLASASDELNRWGFEVDPLDQNACLLRTVPSLLKESKLKEAFQEILAALEETGGGPAWEDRLCKSLACHGAVRAGKSLTTQEMRELLLSLEETELPYTCPHGRPTMVYLSSVRLAREFGRT